MNIEESNENYGAGWVKLHRSVMGKAWYKKPEYGHLWNHLILKSTHRPFEVWFDGKSVVLEPGQFVTGRKKLAEETGIQESKVERILNYFESTENQITQIKSSASRIISIVNYSSYQSNENHSLALHRTGDLHNIEPKIGQQNEQHSEQPSTEEILWKVEQRNEQPSEQRVNNDRTTSEQRVNTIQEQNTIRTKEVKALSSASQTDGVPDPELLIKHQAERLEYSIVEKDAEGISNYLKTKAPKIHEPYVDFWNLFAAKYGCAQVKTVSESRKRKIKVRLADKNFNFCDILKAASKQEFALKGKWFTFDWLIENDTNFIKVMEMKYVKAAVENKNDQKIEITPRRTANFDDNG